MADGTDRDSRQSHRGRPGRLRTELRAGTATGHDQRVEPCARLKVERTAAQGWENGGAGTYGSRGTRLGMTDAASAAPYSSDSSLARREESRARNRESAAPYV